MTDPIAAARALIEPLTGYTPGPWKSWQPRHDESVPVRTDGLGVTIAYVHQGAVTHAGHNARLIVAAPDLRAMVATLADALEAEMKRAEMAEAENQRLREALVHIDALDPEGGAASFSVHALRGAVNRMGEIARKSLAPTDTPQS